MTKPDLILNWHFTKIAFDLDPEVNIYLYQNLDHLTKSVVVNILNKKGFVRFKHQPLL